MFARHPRRKGPLAVTAAFAAATMSLAACGGGGAAPGSSAGGTSSGPITVGIINQQTGPLAIYGKQVVDGLNAGLKYATKGTGKVQGRELKFKVVDDGRDATKMASAFTSLVGEGVKVFGGTVDSGLAVQQAALAKQNNVLLIGGNSVGDGLTGANKNTFRSSRQIAQEVASIKGLLNKPNAKVTVLAQDYATGQGYAKAIKATLTEANVSDVLVPLSAKEFTPYAQRVASAKPDLLVVIFYGETTAALWKALDQQGVTSSTEVIAPLVEPSSYGQYGPSVGKIKFFAQYFPAAAKNPVNDFLLKEVPDASLSTADGFTNAQMIVHALEASTDDVPTMIKSLEGWSFEAPKGKVSIRPGDHALIQPMFFASLKPAPDGKLQPQLVKTVDASTVTPPQK